MKRYVVDDDKLKQDWDYEKNKDLNPKELSCGSEKKAWWICENGHSYEQSICSRSRTKKCPVCTGHKILVGYNDLATTNPDLLKEWDYEKNNILNVTPNNVSKGSEKKVWWICSECNNKWFSQIYPRTKGIGCPKCGLNKLASKITSNTISKKGSLYDNYKNLNSEWDYEKNKDLNPKELSCGSEKKAWWICENGHSYKMQIDLKVKYNRKCPICTKGKRVSFQEKCVAYYIRKVDKNIIESYSDKKNNLSEIDIYLPNKNVGIEYDGQNWHKDKSKDIYKNYICSINNIKLYRIREIGCPELNDLSIDYYYNPNNINELNIIINKIIKGLYNIDINVDIKKDELDIIKFMGNYYYDNSAINLSQDILDEWDYELNLQLNPKNFSLQSHKTVWWKCKTCKGTWKTSIANRFNGRGCPYCTGHKLLKGFNDLKSLNPTLCKEWDYEKNEITPDNITSHSGKKVWWICENGHSYESKISNRNDLKRGCPYCAGKKKVKR